MEATDSVPVVYLDKIRFGGQKLKCLMKVLTGYRLQFQIFYLHRLLERFVYNYYDCALAITFFFNIGII